MFEKIDSLNKQQMNDCSFQQVLPQNSRFALTKENVFSERFNFNVN